MKTCQMCGVNFDGLEAVEVCQDCINQIMEEEQIRRERLEEFEASQPTEDPRDYKYYRDQSNEQ